jgi:aminopeptidase N
MKRLLLHVSPLIIAALQLFAGSDDTFRRIDIVHTDLHITVSADTATLYGEVHFTAIAAQNLTDETPLRMHYYRIQIDSVYVNGVKTDAVFVLIPEIEFFDVLIPETMTIPAGDTLTVSIWYTRFDHWHPKTDASIREGYYFFRRGENRWGQTAPETIGYTMSQPRDARAWVPTIDKPWNKSTLTMQITVDKPMNVIANGELIDQTTHPDGSVTYVYNHLYPVAPYLYAFNIGPFHEYESIYTSEEGSIIPITSYLLQNDAAWADSANSMMRNMMLVFEELFGPYPFDRYGMIAIQPFRYGGMEHQTITTMRHSLFLSERITAHELAHQWWGNLVTCESWENIWLNEGFASYAEALYEEAKTGIAGRNAVMDWFAERYFAEDSVFRYSLYNPPESRLFGIAIYQKGAWVLHMLRNLVGDEIFFDGLRTYGNDHAYSVASTEDLRNSFETVFDDDLEWFFDQWVYQPGYPEYHITTTIGEQDNGGLFEINIILEQKQLDAPEVFDGPAEFLFRSGNVDTVITFWNNERLQEFLVSTHSRPDTIIFDPENKILKKIDGVTGMQEREALPDQIWLSQNYPNPFNASTVIEYSVPELSYVRMRVIDSIGRDVTTLVDGVVPAGRYTEYYDATGNASGVYFVLLEVEGRSKVRKMTYIR